uniref:HMG box domain-containing protein n=1 Tax=Ciona savignyi TaxID=51511 RepID=H2ZMN2_CIOSA
MTMIIPPALRPASLLYLSKFCGNAFCAYSTRARPKRPLTSFFLFLGEKRKEPRYSGLRVYQVAKVAAEEWNQMNQEEKQPYIDQMKSSFSNYHDRYQEYRNQLTDVQVHDLSVERMEKRTERAKKQEKKMKVQLGAPKRARSAYSFYLISKMKSVPLREGKSFGLVVKQWAQEWNEMTAQQKEVYQTMAAEDKLRHNHEMHEFIGRLQEVGKLHLLPKVEQVKLRREQKLKANKEMLERMLSLTVEKMRRFDIQE